MLNPSEESALWSTVSFADFDIHPLTGFVPFETPLSRLPAEWDVWERALEDATRLKLQLGASVGLTDTEKFKSEGWRIRVRELPVVPITNLKESGSLLRRAHGVLTYLLHFYAHSMPPDAEVRIPPSLSLPLLQVSAKLDIPSVMTYADDITNNWTLKEDTPNGTSILDNLRSQLSFTGTKDEEAFYLSPLRVELRGAEALRIMQNTLNDLAAGGPDTEHKVTEALLQLARVFKGLKEALLSVREACNPDFFFRSIRPWLIGGDSNPNRKWVFEGIERDPTLKEPTLLSGSSAAQSALIQTLDGFLGVEKPRLDGHIDTTSVSLSMPFAHRMRLYMPRRHREFLARLTATGSALRHFVTLANSSPLSDAYNAAIAALKEFRDAHMIIVTLYIIQPSKRLLKEEAEQQGVEATENHELKGSAGGELACLLKDFRQRTTSAIIPSRSNS
ncbi:hypothetical protein H0H92_005675 [Tricholoma furcatifolium]|nr:hypothetical protein H0H92_005675 [Tricholoma furcatifolium]